MLTTLRATLSPAGTLTFDETVQITHPVAVLVTLLEEPPKLVPAANVTDPLDWPLSDVERSVWDELPAFRAQYPVRLDALDVSP